MTVPLRNNLQFKIADIKPKVYPLGHKLRKLVDSTIDELQSRWRLVFTKSHILFSFPVFMVWKSTSKGKQKGKAVVNTRKQNDMVVPDSYPLLLQSEIITNVQRCTNLAVLDVAFFFYQWQLDPDHRFIFTVVKYQGHEIFQVFIVGYINFIAYVQQEINTILCVGDVWSFVYIDDIVGGATSVADAFQEPRVLFEIFVAYNISIKRTKIYLNYPDIGFLGQRVNFLGLTTSDDKLRAIQLLCYSKTLGALEYYLGLIGYLQSYIHFYAQLTEPLQLLKTLLLRSAPIAGAKRRDFASKTKLPLSSQAEKASFLSLQDTLSRPLMLVNHDFAWNLWVHLDVSKKFGFGAMMFHSRQRKEEMLEENWLKRSTVEPISFHPRLLTTAKKNYWLSKFK